MMMFSRRLRTLTCLLNNNNNNCSSVLLFPRIINNKQRNSEISTTFGSDAKLSVKFKHSEMY